MGMIILPKVAGELDWSRIKWFQPEDFQDPKYPGSWKEMDVKSVIKIDWLRKNTGWPIKIMNAVSVEETGHSTNSRHYITHPEGCSAIDFYFETDASVNEQVLAVMHSGFNGIGVHYNRVWKGKVLSIDFHVDRREHFSVWKKDGDEYFLLV